MKLPVGERKKSVKFWAPHLRALSLPFGPPTLRAQPLQPTPKKKLAKCGLAKFGQTKLAKFGHIRLAKSGLAKCGRDRPHTTLANPPAEQRLLRYPAYWMLQQT